MKNGQAQSATALPLMTQAVSKLKTSKRDENDILEFDFKIEFACDVGS